MPAADNQVAIILLAAGAASRFGRDKLQELIGGRRVIDWTIDAANASGLNPILIVVRPDQPNLTNLAIPVVNPTPDEGLSSSVRCGLTRAAELNCIAAILSPTDQPLLSPAVFVRLANAFNNGSELAIATYHGKPRNPVMLAKSRWPDTMTLTGDIGLSALVRSPSATHIECGDIGSVDDIDTPADLVAIQPRLLAD